jgi:hypothetical protein
MIWEVRRPPGTIFASKAAMSLWTSFPGTSFEPSSTFPELAAQLENRCGVIKQTKLQLTL